MSEIEPLGWGLGGAILILVHHTDTFERMCFFFLIIPRIIAHTLRRSAFDGACQPYICNDIRVLYTALSALPFAGSLARTSPRCLLR